MRGIAILLVLLYHNFSFVEYFNYGWLGVDLFFVLSGFLITDILLKSIGSTNYFKNFYYRRILRIFPLYYLSLLLFIIILPLFSFFTLDMSYYKENQVWFWLYLQNWILIFNQEGQGFALNHFWSLAVEEQYYLLWPLLVFWVNKPKRLLILCLVLLIAVIGARFLIWEYRETIPAYERLFLFTRIDGLLIGSMFAILYHTNPTILRKNFTVFLLILTAVNFIFYLFKYRLDPEFPLWAIAGYPIFSVVFVLLIYEAVMLENWLIKKVLTSSILRFLGRYSYGIYVFHLPIFLLSKPYTDRFTISFISAGNWLQLTLSALLCTVFSIIISLASYHLFEKHFLRLKKHYV